MTLKHIVLLFAILLPWQANASWDPKIVVIANVANSTGELKRSELIKIFLRKVTHFPNGDVVTPRDQTPGPVKALFYRGLFDYSLEEIDDYWIREVFRGGLTPPQSQDTSDDKEMVAWIAKNPFGIGYTERSALTSSVKVLRIDP